MGPHQTSDDCFNNSSLSLCSIQLDFDDLHCVSCSWGCYQNKRCTMEAALAQNTTSFSFRVCSPEPLSKLFNYSDLPSVPSWRSWYPLVLVCEQRCSWMRRWVTLPGTSLLLLLVVPPPPGVAATRLVALWWLVPDRYRDSGLVVDLYHLCPFVYTPLSITFTTIAYKTIMLCRYGHWNSHYIAVNMIQSKSYNQLIIIF